ncbi:uncharacterized protein LOC128421092 [Podarcis raffonei]|uniref:uncharacterized protein LOC128421092 n=1 Tax=Podarcis raffonei TaxID=65483 RepID=UPI0023292A4D|nr:uncharacterized protein LOC128421092 [Podarcis raffonei]
MHKLPSRIWVLEYSVDGPGPEEEEGGVLRPPLPYAPPTALPAPGAAKDDESDEEKEEDEEFRQTIRKLTKDGKRWTEEQRKRVRDFVEDFKKEIDVSGHLVSAAECKRDQWKKKQRHWEQAWDRAALHKAAKEQKERAEKIAPLRRVYDPPGPPGVEGAPAPQTYTVQHVPFSSADVCNWRNQNPSFEENPAKIIKLFEGIFKTYNPTYDDVQYLLDSLLTTAALLGPCMSQLGEQRRILLYGAGFSGSQSGITTSPSAWHSKPREAFYPIHR